MTISKERKAELTAKFGKNAQDTGNSKVQVAILTDRIKELTEHMKSHQKDFHTRRGLLMLVGKRRRLLSYIKKNDINEYRELIKELGIRDNIQSGRESCMQGAVILAAPFSCKGPKNRSLHRRGSHDAGMKYAPARRGAGR